ncbi:MAG: TIGR03571 family LLM class oxidoreductase, partial [Pseudomonadota bacterium]
RDEPYNEPSLGDAGQMLDPFVYLGALAMHTSTLGLGVSSIILPLRHPAHVAKAAMSADALSNGRLLLGVASGDRPDEYPALNVDYATRGERFRDSVDYIRKMSETAPLLDNYYGRLDGHIDMLPKPGGNDLPLLITGSSQQSDAWIAANGDGWMTYPRPAAVQSPLIKAYRARAHAAGVEDKPVMEPLYIDLASDRAEAPSPIHLGIRAGSDALIDYLQQRQDIGVNHIALNLRFNQDNIEDTLHQLAETVLPAFTEESKA